MSGSGGFPERDFVDACPRFMAGHVERGEVAGVVTLLCRHGEIHVDAVGAQDFCGPGRRCAAT